MINLEQYFKALAYKKRLDMFSYLIENGECTIDQLVTKLDLPYKTVFRNLSVLRNTGFIESRTKNMESIFKVKKDAGETANYLIDLINKQVK